MITRIEMGTNDFFSREQGGFAEMVSYAVVWGIFYGTFLGLLRLLLSARYGTMITPADETHPD